ncbi:SGNH/GDSL hydrolase family protein [Paracoccus sp. CPCC 101403]|uniref:SGNH/GDSL hydrolase family protein n=1 Tax=Paracoccus broussonetiae TaxID=3075834 RepID=A0ABU3EAL7_9RHOB|nr:SGNH/GDSL hydrolase family protein [Paracoccus sp. CPCC 101403]MDT1061191.1 SGNH/GDSL hydrolase family protein [Paracoccus sp. CPCC 101403]
MPTFPDDTPLSQVRQLLNLTGLRQNGFVNQRPPINTDDLRYGWEVGSRWLYDNMEWVCLGNDESAAVWQMNMTGESTYEVWLETHPGGTKEEYLADMSVDPSPEMQAMLDDAQTAAGDAQAAEASASASAAQADAAASQSAGVNSEASYARGTGGLNLRGTPLGVGAISKTTGAVLTNPDWRYTGFIPLPASPLISFIGTAPAGSDTFATFVFFDANFAVVERANSVGEALLDIWATESAAARYVRVTIAAADVSTYQLRIVSAAADRTPTATDALRATITVNPLAAAHLGGYLGIGTGAIVAASNSWAYTDMLPVMPGQVLDYIGSANTTVGAAVALYDPAGVYLRDMTGLATSGGGVIKVQTGRFVIPEGVGFIRASAATTQPMSLTYRRGKEGVEYAEDVIQVMDDSTGLERSRLRQSILALLESSALPVSVVSQNGMGDSITVGANATSAPNRWLNRLAAALSATLTNSGIGGTVLQSSPGVGGTPLNNNGRNRCIDVFCGSDKTELAIVAYGFNDARYVASPGTFTAALYQSDLGEVITGLMLHGYARDKILIVGPYYISDTGLITGSDGFAGQTRSGFEAYVTAARVVASDYGVLYFDAYAYMAANGGAALISDDFIHPTDEGHRVIFEGIDTTADFVNTFDAPKITSWAASAGNLVLTYGAIAGATGYEVATGLMGTFAFGAEVSNAGTTYSVAAPGSGVYAARVRAVFGSQKGPWAVAPNGASTSTALLDNFDSTFSERLTVHAPTSGGLWVENVNYTGDSHLVTGGIAYPTVLSCCYICKGAAMLTDGYVEGDLIITGTPLASRAGIVFRASESLNTMYIFQYSQPNAQWQLLSLVGGTSTTLGTAAASPAVDTTYVMRLEVTGTSLTCRVNGAIVIGPITNSAIAGAGWAGIRNGTASTSVNGARWQRFAAG